MSSSSVWNKSDSVKIECTCQGWNKTCQKLTALYVCVGVIALSQIVLYTYLYKHISLMEGPYFPDDFPDSETPESRIRRETSDMDNSVASKAEVEFISPSLRAQIEAERSATNSTDPWVWLTSYSRIPMFAIQEFCAATKEYCPPGLTGPIGPAGLPGLKGDKGNKGDSGERGVKGDPGPRGPVGPPGDVGPRGPRGDQGPPGSPGLDGRDGIPGEPGLDGIPGRNGIDGIPGRAGSSGTDGTPGVPGSNGTDGIPGKTGPIGPPGPMGPKGLPGPKGRPGKPGTNGTPGTPGIQAWGVTVNGTKSSELLIPPAIVGSETIFASGPIVAREGENVRLMCAATGNPRPIVQWRKLDKPTIGLGKWQEYSVLGGTFNITRINREHMGLYMCIASNGIPPSANQSFILEVHFPPLIRIQNQHVGIKNHSTATLQCEVEAYPDAVKYWEAEDGSLIEASDKYIISSTDIGKYRTLMELNITNVNYMDYGTYHCISKNELGLTKGVFKVYEMRPGLVPPHGPDTIAVYGERPPERVDINDLCPAPPACQECPKELRCNQGIYSLYDLTGHRDLEILPLDLNRTYPGLPNRTLDCQVYAVGKPVFLKDSEKLYGSWMRDPLPKSEQEKYWTTSEDNNLVLYEYANKTMYRNSIPTKEYKLKFPFSGNTHVIYNGSFFYHQNKLPEIIKYELSTETSQPLPMPHAFVNESNYLYSSEKNFMDFSVDDNGLWVIYGLPESNNTAVVKVDAYSLEIQYAWNISLKHQRAGEMFIVCGVLYVVDSVMDRKTHIRFALDLYKNLLLEDHQPIEFTNPFRRTTMIGYNHKHKELYTWDKGNQLTYPIRYHEIGYNVSKEEKNEPEANKLQSGYEVF